MKYQSTTSIGGLLVNNPAPSERRQKVDFNANRRPPTLDDIFEAVKKGTLMASPNVSKLFKNVIVPSDGTGRATSSDFYNHVEQFNFGALQSKDIRDAEREGHEFIKHGLFQLPYPVCLFRCQVHYPDGEPLGMSLLLVDAQYERDRHNPDEKPGFACVAFTHDTKYVVAMHSINTLVWKDTPEGTAIQIEVPRKEHAYWADTVSSSSGELTLTDMAEGSLVAVGLTMILNTKNIKKERTEPPAKPNKARAAAGRPLLPWVTRVFTGVYNRAVQPGEGTHASPRPHRRRAHVRYYGPTAYREGYHKPVAAMLVNWDGAPLERGQYEVHDGE